MVLNAFVLNHWSLHPSLESTRRGTLSINTQDKTRQGKTSTKTTEAPTQDKYQQIQAPAHTGTTTSILGVDALRGNTSECIRGYEGQGTGDRKEMHWF
mmetsp:Transcript_3229/g.5641  ORF Transcript_3229/g.5641 Transcript_3229/m.5641 type:complete len:98 (-) Transcript_3229:111-404(-)